MTWRGEAVAMLLTPPAHPGDHHEVHDADGIAQHDGEAEAQPLEGEPCHEVEQAHPENARGEHLDEGLDHLAAVVRVQDDHDGQAIDRVSHHARTSRAGARSAAARERARASSLDTRWNPPRSPRGPPRPRPCT